MRLPCNQPTHTRFQLFTAGYSCTQDVIMHANESPNLMISIIHSFYTTYLYKTYKHSHAATIIISFSGLWNHWLVYRIPSPGAIPHVIITHTLHILLSNPLSSKVWCHYGNVPKVTDLLSPLIIISTIHE